MRVVLDTNVLISGIFWKGIPAQVLELWAHGKIEVLVTDNILHEYFLLLDRMDPTNTLGRRWKIFLIEHTQIILTKHTKRFSRDPFDDMFIHCALTGEANYIISGDKDLLDLKKISDIPIVKPKYFMSTIQG